MDIRRLNISHLKYFCDTIEKGSFAAAAELNHISRPAISKAIMQLEENVGVPLFLHGKRLTVPTREGKAFARDVGLLLGQLSSLVSGQIRSTSLIKIGVSYSIFKDFMLDKVAPYLRNNKDIHISFSFGTSHSLLSKLASGEIDLAILINDRIPRLYKSKTIKKGKFIILRGSGNIPNNKFFVTENRSEVLELKGLRSNNPSSKHDDFIVVESWSACRDLAEKNLGLAFVPDFMNKHRMASSTPKLRTSYLIEAVWYQKELSSEILKLLEVLQK